jgi:hypothetical protein
MQLLVRPDSKGWLDSSENLAVCVTPLSPDVSNSEPTAKLNGNLILDIKQ